MNSDAALYTLGSIGTAAINSAGNKKSQKRAYKYSRRLQVQAQEWQEKMWQMANDYNLPVNEVQRLLDAGINPALSFSNGGASAAPVPSTSTASQSAPSLSVPNLGDAVRASQNAELVDSQVALNSASADRQSAEAEAARKQAGLSDARKNLVENELKIRSDPSYIQAMIDQPGLKRDIARLDRDSKSLDYSYDLETYGNRVESSNLSLDQQKLNYVSSYQQYQNLVRDYDLIGARIANLEAGTDVERAQAAVLRQDLDIRAGKALLGTLERDALEYCYKHGVSDAVTGEVKSFVSALADEYSSKISDRTYSSKSSAITANQESIYESEHGQERRSLETELVRRRGNYLRTSQWNMSINTGISFVKTAIDGASTVMTRGMSKVVGGLITPNSNHSNFPLSPEAQKVLREVFPETERRLTY